MEEVKYMQTKIIKINDVREQEKDFEEAGTVIRNGGLVAFPTETVYGLGANGLNAEACAGIYRAKGRPSDNPLILHVCDRAMVDVVAAEVTPLAEKILAAFCPGPITMLLPKRSAVPDSVTGGLGTVGVRMPDNDTARALIRAAGVPVAAPSANISGRPSPTTAEAVASDMEGRISVILDGGPCRFGVESTIVDCTGDTAVILRPGAVTREMLEEVCGRVEMDPALVGADTVPRAPGMKYTHYAPKAPLTLIHGKPEMLAEAFTKKIREGKSTGKKVGVIVSRGLAEKLKEDLPAEVIAVYGTQGNYQEIAAHLYEALRSFDHKDVDILLGEATEEDGLGLAIMNRFRKSAGGRIIEA